MLRQASRKITSGASRYNNSVYSFLKIVARQGTPAGYACAFSQSMYRGTPCSTDLKGRS